MLSLDDVLDEEQVISIFGDLTRKNPRFPYWKFETIDVQLSDMSEAEVRAQFRFAPFRDRSSLSSSQNAPKIHLPEWNCGFRRGRASYAPEEICLSMLPE